MSEVARANGWRGFEGMGLKVPGGYEYRCDGMPSPMGCGESMTTTRELARVGIKKSGWFVCYGLDEDGEPDRDVVLTFCPRCTQMVLTHPQPTEP